MAKRKKTTKAKKIDWHEVAYVALLIVAGLAVGAGAIFLARFER